MSAFEYPETIDENAARISAGFGVAFAASAALLAQWWFLPLLAAGYFIRATVGPRFSPLALFSQRVVVPALKLKPRPAWAPPKRFAQAIGFAFSATAAVAALDAQSFTVARVLLLVLAFCAGLESFAGFCLGCRAYDLVVPAFERARLAFKRR